MTAPSAKPACLAGNLIEVYGEGPFAVTFVNPEDDPNRAKKK